jgi:hypothetical protein
MPDDVVTDRVCGPCPGNTPPTPVARDEGSFLQGVGVALLTLASLGLYRDDDAGAPAVDGTGTVRVAERDPWVRFGPCPGRERAQMREDDE